MLLADEGVYCICGEDEGADAGEVAEFDVAEGGVVGVVDCEG